MKSVIKYPDRRATDRNADAIRELQSAIGAEPDVDKVTRKYRYKVVFATRKVSLVTITTPCPNEAIILAKADQIQKGNDYRSVVSCRRVKETDERCIVDMRKGV